MTLPKLYEEKRFEELLKVSEDLMNRDNQDGEALYWQLMALYETGQKEKAITIGSKSVPHIKDLTWKGRLYNRIGTFYWRIGDFQNAEASYNQSINFSKKGKSNWDIASATNNLGILYDLRGQLDEALKLYRKALDINTRANDIGKVASNNVNIGIIYGRQGNYIDAEDLFLTALSTFKEKNQYSGIVVVSHELMLLYYKINKLDKANEMYKLIESTVKTHSSSFTRSVYELSTAIKLKNTRNMKDTVKAMEIFESISQNPLYEYEQKINSLLHLIDLKIHEFKLLSNFDVLDEIKDHLSQILIFAEHNKTHPLVIETMLVRSRLLSIYDEYKLAHEKIIEAYKYIEKNQLNHLRAKVEEEETNFENNIAKIKALMDSNKAELTKMELSSIQEYLKSVQSFLD